MLRSKNLEFWCCPMPRRCEHTSCSLRDRRLPVLTQSCGSINLVRGSCDRLGARGSKPATSPDAWSRSILADDRGRVPSWRTAPAQGHSRLANRVKALCLKAESTTGTMNGAEGINVLESSRIQQHLRVSLPALRARDGLSESRLFRIPGNDLPGVSRGGAETAVGGAAQGTTYPGICTPHRSLLSAFLDRWTRRWHGREFQVGRRLEYCQRSPSIWTWASFWATT